MGVALVDIEWEKFSDNNTTYGSKWENCPQEMVTTENQQVTSHSSQHSITIQIILYIL